MTILLKRLAMVIEEEKMKAYKLLFTLPILIGTLLGCKDMADNYVGRVTNKFGFYENGGITHIGLLLSDLSLEGKNVSNSDSSEVFITPYDSIGSVFDGSGYWMAFKFDKNHFKKVIKNDISSFLSDVDSIMTFWARRGYGLEGEGSTISSSEFFSWVEDSVNIRK